MKNGFKNTMLVLVSMALGAALAGPAASAAQAALSALPSTQRIYVDGSPVQMQAYSIDGSNYVKVRDLGKAVGFNVRYDAAANSVQIESDKPYSEESAATPIVAASSGTVTLPTDGSKYTPSVGDRILCDDGTVYEVKDITRFENNVFAPDFSPELPKPAGDWSRFPAIELPRVDVRHFSDAAGDDLFIRNLYETRRMVYTIYNALETEPAGWRDGKPLAKISMTIPAEEEPYTGYFWPWRSSEVEKHVRNLPNSRFKVEAWDYYHNGVFMDTRYYISTV